MNPAATLKHLKPGDPFETIEGNQLSGKFYTLISHNPTIAKDQQGQTVNLDPNTYVILKKGP